MTDEGKVKRRVSALLKEHGAYYLMPVPSGFGAPTIDYHGHHQGRAFGIETKKGCLQPTPRQALTMKEMEAAGGKTFLINEVTGLDALREWLTCNHKEI